MSGELSSFVPEKRLSKGCPLAGDLPAGQPCKSLGKDQPGRMENLEKFLEVLYICTYKIYTYTYIPINIHIYIYVHILLTIYEKDKKESKREAWMGKKLLNFLGNQPAEVERPELGTTQGLQADRGNVGT